MTKRNLLATASFVALVPARAFALAAVLDNVDDLPEDVKKEYVQQGDKWILQVTGMKSQADFDRVQGALNNEKRDHGALKSKITQHFGDKKFEDIQADLDRIPELEARSGEIDESKINAIVEGRVRTHIAPVERENANLKQQLGERDATITDFQGKERTRTIHDKAREAAVSAKMLPEAVDDFLMLADRVLEVRDDDGKVVVKDQVGFTPGVEPSVLLTDLQQKRPHWWGPSSGGGAGGNRDGNGGGNSNPWTREHWNMTEQGRIMQSNPQKAEQLAKAAGHKDAATAVKPAEKA